MHKSNREGNLIHWNILHESNNKHIIYNEHSSIFQNGSAKCKRPKCPKLLCKETDIVRISGFCCPRCKGKSCDISNRNLRRLYVIYVADVVNGEQQAIDETSTKYYSTESLVNKIYKIFETSKKGWKYKMYLL